MKKAEAIKNAGDKNMHKHSVAVFVTLAVLFASCEGWIAVPAPDTDIMREDVFEDDATAQAALAHIYGQLTPSAGFANGALVICLGAYTDELTSYTPSASSNDVVPFYFNTVVPANSMVSSTWGTCYSAIYSANLFMEGLAASKLSAPLKKQLQGEALFIRAFCHFYLVGLFGDVPLVTTSDYRVNAKASRTPEAQVYAGIIADLVEAKDLLSDSYPSDGRVRANRGAATALLARTYLYAGIFVNAEAQATEVIGKTNQYRLQQDDLNTVFLNTSEEAIWQLLPEGLASTNSYTYEGSVFILLAPPTRVALRNELLNAFEDGDQRKASWVSSFTSSSGLSTWYYPFKYKQNHLNATGAENVMVLRLAEQYLIRAEARVKQDKLTEAQGDLDIIRGRAGLASTAASSKEELLAAIEHERRVEFFAEFGHRFFDLKRLDRLDAVMPAVKATWRSFNAQLPLPQSEILINKNLEQNPGY
ncbi:MAG TPA: RagB/SusD family nutrient uptake outer membrane protein [Chryseolinea sp.]|nr:RagB/SusD family nutrient uptake outer membrane protein [Chryseolinea sp.]